jgi:hypothetical protein
MRSFYLFFLIYLTQITFNQISAQNIVLSSNITQNTTLRSGFIYELAGRITVFDGVTLTIEPGVIIKGQPGTGANATALLIARGARLIAEGTPNRPIIFTSTADAITCNHPNYPGMVNLTPVTSGLWGGLIVLGNAPISASASEVQIEGIPTTDANGLYGGTNATDNSGVLKYISIRHSGANIGNGNEINGLTLGGVGSGTVVENIEIIANQDDGIEIFGGTVNVRNVLVLNSGDDAIDTDQSWGGTLDNFIIICGPATDHALEIDGPEGTLLASHNVRNGTIKGDSTSELADFRACPRGTFENLFFFGFPDPATAGRGDFSLSNPTGSTCTTDNFANAILTFNNLQTVLPAGVSLSAVFKNGTSVNATAVAMSGRTEGANICEFTNWTLAYKDGLLNQDFVFNPIGCNNPQSSNYCPFAANASNCRFDSSALCGNFCGVGTDNITVCNSFTWRNGITYTNSNNTDYYVVPNAGVNGCDSLIFLNLTVTNPGVFFGNVNFVANPTAGFSPLTVFFNNQTPNLNNYSFAWDFGDGNVQINNSSFVTHTYVVNGIWDVSLITTHYASGCVDTLRKNGYVFSSGGVSCSHTATVLQNGPQTGCRGSLTLTCNTNSNFTYQWLLNGSPVSGANSSSYNPQFSGNYSVIISSNNCPVYSASVAVTILPSPQPVISSSGTIQPCFSGGIATLNAGSGYASYNWSTGANTQLANVSQSGNYIVSVTDNNGCVGVSQPFSVNASLAQVPSICFVGTNSLTNSTNNMIVWEKPISTIIDSFFVYKETNVANVYSKIGSKSYADTAVFIDFNSNIAVQPYRYRISVFDSCGVVSAQSNYHQSIHLTINQGVGNSWNLIWTKYEGIQVPTYNIYRGSSAGNLTLISTVSGNINTFTDINPPVSQSFYQIEVLLPYTCDPVNPQRAPSTFNSILSNIANSPLTSIEFIENNLIEVKLYPNPTTGNAFIEFEQIVDNVQIKIFNYLAHLQRTIELEFVNRIELELPLEQNLFFVEITTDKGKKTIPVVKLK